MVEKPATTRREVQVDLSGLTQRQRFLREEVITLGEKAFGARWQSVFAAELSKHVGRPVRQAQVSHWISGYRPVPEAITEPLRDLAMRVAADLAKRSDDIRAKWAPPPVPADDAQALDPFRPQPPHPPGLALGPARRKDAGRPEDDREPLLPVTSPRVENALVAIMRDVQFSAAQIATRFPERQEPAVLDVVTLSADGRLFVSAPGTPAHRIVALRAKLAGATAQRVAELVEEALQARDRQEDQGISETD